jgi:hypothetical protein
MSDESTPEFRPLPRGVYVAPFTVHGDRYLYAVDDWGEHVGFRTVPNGADFNPAVDELWAILDRIPTLSDVSDRPSYLTLVS